MFEYAQPEVLVSTDWVNQHLNDPKVRVIEIDVDTKGYEAGHVPGAIGWNWQTQLQNQISRDILDRSGFEALMSQAGIRDDDTVVLYGDNNNWFAAYGFWLMKVYGHRDVRLMNGGRNKWLNEEDKTLTTDVPAREPSAYEVSQEHPELRARVAEVLEASRQQSKGLLDVRSPDEFTGKVIAPPGMSETAQRGGHIPGAVSVPWATAVAPDGTFKPAKELHKIYIEEKGFDPARPTIAYCRIGERSSHSWFVLRYLLGFDDVKNYDGSWTEYGNLIDVPIERGAPRLVKAS
jgi:thiosulfate/3-mercaptopyruvate sulfurtransferase